MDSDLIQMNCRRQGEKGRGYLVIPGGRSPGHISPHDTIAPAGLRHTRTHTHRPTVSRTVGLAERRHALWMNIFAEVSLPHCHVSNQMKTGTTPTSCPLPLLTPFSCIWFHICLLFHVWMELPRSDVGQRQRLSRFEPRRPKLRRLLSPAHPPALKAKLRGLCVNLHNFFFFSALLLFLLHSTVQRVDTHFAGRLGCAAVSF